MFTYSFSLYFCFLFFERYAGNPSLKVGNASTITSKHNDGVIIGVVIGSTAALAILIVLMIYFIFYYPRHSDENAPHPTMGEVPMPSISKGGK